MSNLAGADKSILDYESGIHRFMNNEKLFQKFLLKFLDDKSFERMKEAVIRQDCEQGFKEAHTLKGVAANLSFTELTEISSELTELLRAGKLAEAAQKLPELEKAYERVVGFLQKVREVSE